MSVGGGGDQLALLRVWNEWVDSDYSAQWCYENYIQVRALMKTRDVRDQFANLCERASLARVLARFLPFFCVLFFKSSFSSSFSSSFPPPSLLLPPLERERESERPTLGRSSSPWRNSPRTRWR